MRIRKSSPSAVFGALFAAMAVIPAASAATGDIDPSFAHPAAPAEVIRQVAATTGGRTLMGGASGSLFRVSHLGERDPGFRKDIFSSTLRIATLRDGKILSWARLGTDSSSTGRLRKLNPDGSEYLPFQIETMDTLHGFAEQPDGRLLVSLRFIQSGLTSQVLRRYQPDGTPDPTFSASINGACRSISVQPDGRILLGGEFTSVGGSPRKNLARLLPDGAVDSSFTANCDGGVVQWILQDQNGGILIGGGFTSVNAVATSRLVRLLADGSLDPTYPSSPGLYRNAYEAQLQSDGKLVVHGGNEAGSRLYRLDASGVVDPTLSWNGSNTTTPVLSLMDDGSILLTGSNSGETGLIPFTHRFFNDPGSSSLGAGPGGSLEWTRTGSLPAVHLVTFEARPSGGTWSAPVPAVWTGGKWRFDGVLPVNGAVRARGETLNAKSSTVVEEILNLGTAAPHISLSVGNDTPLTQGVPFQFPNSLPGYSREMKIKIRNQGDGAMDGISAAITGADASLFTVSYAPPRELGPQEEGELVVRFNGGTAGLKSAVLSITSTDPGSPVHNFPLSAETSAVLSPVFLTERDVAHQQLVSFNGSSYSFGSLTLGFAPQPGTMLTVVDGLLGHTAPFSDLPDGATVSTVFAGVTYDFQIGYRYGGGGADVVLTLVGEGMLLSVLSTEIQYQGPRLARDADGGFITVTPKQDYRVERRRADGLKDPLFHESSVPEGPLIIQPDGKILVGNIRLNRDGTPDPSYQPGPQVVKPLGVQKDGRILVAATFFPYSSDLKVKRLMADGTEDTGFVADMGSSQFINHAEILPDGNIIVCAPAVIKLSPTGAQVPSFQSTMSGRSVVVQPDGRILVVKAASNNNLTDSYLIRLNADGSVDTSFNMISSGHVESCVLQADGKILMGGNFTRVNGTPLQRVARLLPDGQVDPLFRCEVTGIVRELMLGEGGSLFISGSIETVNGVQAGLLNLVSMGAAESSLGIDGQDLLWLRSGVAPELHAMRAEVLLPGQTAWTFAGHADRVGGGWRASSITLHANATYRMIGEAFSGQSTGLHQTLLSRGSVVPDLRVLSGETVLPSGATFDMGSSLTGLPVQHTLSLMNQGQASLGSISASISGPDAADFTVHAPPYPSLAPLSAVSVGIRFVPGATGPRTATLRITSNDPTVPVHEISLTGVGRNDFSPHFADATQVALTVDAFDATVRTWGGITLGFAPQPGTVLTGIRVTGSAPIGGSLPGLPDLSSVTASYNGKTSVFHSSYRGGDGNDLVFILDGPAIADQSFTPAPNNRPNSIALQDDGKILISGAFTSVGGVTLGGLARLLPDGTLDPTFTVTGTGAESMAVQPDGKVLVACDVTGAGGVQRLRLARLNRDGTLDTSFQANIEGSVYRICLLRNGKVLIGGDFTRVDGATRRSVAILNQNGSLDPSFTANLAGAGASIYSLAEQPDGNLLLGGWYTSVNGVSIGYISRVSVSGQVDQTFNPQMRSQAGGTSSIAVQPDGRIVIGGFIYQIRGTSKNNIARLNADGTLDQSFIAAGNQPSTCLRIQADGKIMVSGLFTTMNGVDKSGIARLLPDGSLDPTFNPRPMRGGTVAPNVYTMVMDVDGSLLIGGNFDSVDHRGGANFVRLGRDEITSTVEVVGTGTVRWNTGGALTEMHTTTFELSTDNGSSWASLGAGARTTGGWSLAGLTLPPSGIIRAKGVQILTNRASSAFTTVTAPFNLPVLTALEFWRELHFGDPFATSVDLLDPDHDGLKNLVEFAFGLEPLSSSVSALPAWELSGGYHVISFNRPQSVSGITYSAEWSTTMEEGDWYLAEDLSVGDAKSFRVPVGGERRKFFRLRVTNP